MDRKSKREDTTKKYNQRRTVKDPKPDRNVAVSSKERVTADSGKKASLTPSEYIKQLSSSPENVILHRIQNNKMESVIFIPNPKIIVFKNFSIGNVYCITLSIRNISQVPHQLRLNTFENVCFKVIFKGSTLNTRLAPGMVHIYDVEFHPDEERDYFHDIEFKTDIGSFTVPVIAVGPKPLISFPDQIDLGQTALRVAKTKPILMQNIGEIATAFNFSTDNPCFTITPSKGSIDIAEAIQVKITFTPNKTGLLNGCIFLRYESGDTVQCLIYGEALACDIQVIEESILFESTYLGLSRMASIEIKNNSNYMLRYKWVMYESLEKDLEEIEKCKEVIIPENDLAQSDTTLNNSQELINQRIFSDKVEFFKKESFAYSNQYFLIFPMNGEVWPHNFTNLSVTFQPKKIGEIHSLAFLEIDGVEKRIAVSLTGKCIGPNLELNILSLNIQEVYLCSTYDYQIVCKNSGPIPGTLLHLRKSAEFGSRITIDPCEVEIDVDELETMKLSFWSNRTGHFVERVDFLVKESSEIFSFVIKGTVICPLVKSCEEDIKFLSAAIGFTQEARLCLKNLSHAPIEFSICIPSDGCNKAITHEDFAKAEIKPHLPLTPREFSLDPQDGLMKPGASLSVNIAFTPNIVRSGDAIIQIQLSRSSSTEALLLPLYFEAKCATFQVIPDELCIRFCFVNFPYSKKLIITNSSDVDGYFYINPQKIDSNANILYSSSVYQGHLKPGESEELTLTIIVTKIGEQTIDLNLLGLGYESPELCCKVICFGEGPVVSVEPCQLDFGEINLLQKGILTIDLTNDSPIPASFMISVDRNASIWGINPSSGELNPNETIKVAISIFLRATGKYSDRLTVTVFNGKPVFIKLLAIGIGTCIVFEPKIFPTFDMGCLFSRQDISTSITVRNEGTSHHLILLTNEEKLKQGKKSTVKDIKTGIFQIEPNVFELPPGSENIVMCKVRSNTPDAVTEQWYLYASIGDSGKRELLSTSTFSATFTQPMTVFSKNEMTFTLNYGWNYEELQQEDEISITNQSGCNMKAHFSILPPFVLTEECSCYNSVLDVAMNNNEPLLIKLYFPFEIEDSEKVPQKYSGYLKITYDEHNSIDKIPCTAEVNFPHLIFIPNEVNLFCVTGRTTQETVKLQNDTPLTVFYKIKWIRESFTYQRLFPSEERGSEGSMTDKTSLHDDDCSLIHSINLDETASFTTLGPYCPMGSEYECVSEPSSVSLDLLDRILQFTPHEGEIPPFAEEEVIFTFNGIENVKVFVQAICQIKGGSPFILNVNAIADTVRCEIQDLVLDFGLHLYCEPAIIPLKILNKCMIPLRWYIETSSNLLRVNDGPEVLNPTSDSIISIEQLPSVPGLFNEKIFLEISYLEIFTLEVRWMATIPQIYLDISRDEAFSKYPVEFGYEAVQIVMSENPIQEKNLSLNCSLSDIAEDLIEITEYQMIQLLDNNWHVIGKNEQYPDKIDIDMAFERLIVKEYFSTYKDTVSCNSDMNNLELVAIVGPGYCINMNFIVVDQSAKFFISLRNYGYEKAKFKLKKEEVKRKSLKSCFTVQIEKNTEICQCETTFLNLSFHPKKELFTKKRTDVTYHFNLEVKQGLIIPVTLKASAVYPQITANVRTLNFERVFIGQCREMSLILKNDGHVDCEWEISIEATTKHPSRTTENPFYVHLTNYRTIVGEESVVRIYFRPYKTGNSKRNLVISVRHGQDSQIISLIGYGVERKLKIKESNIRFPVVVPNTTMGIENLIIENENPYPVELFWQHLEDFSELNSMVRILKHYYRVEEILIPQRKIAETLPKNLLDFYNNLLQDICIDDDFKLAIQSFCKSEDKSDNETLDIQNKEEMNQSESPQLLVDFLKTYHHDEIETLMHAFIDKLQEDPNFFRDMKDPLEKLLETTASEPSNNDLLETPFESEKDIVIIFHGAPYTEYQETACRSAKSLNLPLLNLDQIFIEALAYSQTESVEKIAKQIENRYKELVAKVEKLKTSEMLSNRRSSDKLSKILQIIRKIPPSEEFEIMDKYTYYECKLEIVEFMSSFELLESFGKSKGKGKSNDESQNLPDKKKSLLPGVNRSIFEEILKERLFQPKYKNGYVLQTLKNDLVKDEVLSLNILLEATGKAKKYVFITFYNSFELFESKLLQLDAMESERKREEIMSKFEKMSPSDINLLSDYDKILYDSWITRKNLQMCSDSKNETQSPKEPLLSVKKSQKSSQPNDGHVSARSSTNFHAQGDRKTIGHNIEDIEQIMEEMGEYESKLNIILGTIVEWEMGKSSEMHKSLKNSRSKKKSLMSIRFGLLPTDKFFIWHVRSGDPWDIGIYDSVVQTLSSQGAMKFDSFSEESNDNRKPSRLTVQPRTYSILKECQILPKPFLIDEIFNVCSRNTMESSELEESESSGENSLHDSYEPIDSRWFLKPYESRKLLMQFSPPTEGFFQSSFILRLVDDVESTFRIDVEGIAAIPRLNMAPGSIFDKVNNCKMNESHEPAYFLHEQVYDFGNLLVPSENKKPHEKKTQFQFKNVSAVSADVTFSLTNDSHIFSIYPLELHIESYEIGIIYVTCSTKEFGIFSEELNISIKNNDKPEKIQLRCCGIGLKIEFDQTQIQWGRVLINRLEEQTLVFKNQTAIPIYWRLLNDADQAQIEFEPSEGKLKYREKNEIRLSYHASQVSTKVTDYLKVEFYLDKDDEESIGFEVISMTAESYEINYRIETQNPIDLKNIPIGATASESFTIQNLGSYEFAYKILFQDLEKFKKSIDGITLSILKRDFAIEPSIGIIPAKKQSVVNIKYSPSTEIVLKLIPLMKCIFIEPYKDIGEISQEPLIISATSYYSRLQIEPYPTLDFGTQALKSTKTMQLKIGNTGKFSLKYSIANKSKEPLPNSTKTRNKETTGKKNRTVSKQSKRASALQNQVQSDSVTWGPFHIEKIGGELASAQTDTLIVRCKSDAIGYFQENINILVSDCLPTDDFQITLSVKICLANIDFENYNGIFSESYIVDSIEEIDYTEKQNDFTIFSKSTMTLHFCGVCVESLHTTCITLLNDSTVKGDVAIEISEESSPDTYRVNTNSLTIPPLTKQSFTVIFEPSTLGIFSSKLNVKLLDTPDDIEPRIFSINLEGESCAPQIRIIEPVSIDTIDPVIDFGSSLVSQPTEVLLKIQNISQITATITVEILDNEELVYSIYLGDGPLKCSDKTNDEIGQSKIVCRIRPCETSVIRIRFVSSRIKIFRSRLLIQVDKNPYETMGINLIGEGFTSSIILDTLKMSKALVLENSGASRVSFQGTKLQRQSLRSDGYEELKPIPVAYTLDYGRCFLNRVNKINFKIMNKTTYQYFRFEWNSNENLVCTPMAGHIAPGSFKELTAMLYASEPAELTQVPYECLIDEIVLAKPAVEPTWDTRQTQVSWMEKLPSSTEFDEAVQEEDIFVKKVVHETEEPEFQIVPGTLQIIQLLVSGTLDYSDYECEIDTIHFGDTLMFHTSEYKFTLKNIGPVNLDFSWNLVMDEQYPIRLDKLNYEHESWVRPYSVHHNQQDENCSSSNRTCENPNGTAMFQNPGCFEESSDLFSSSAGLTDRSTDSWIEGENWPFKICPESGSLGSGEQVECVLIFAPIDVFEYKAYLGCKIDNLNPEKKPPRITVTATSLLPYCHFDINKSDYLTSGRRDNSLSGPSGYTLDNPEIREEIRIVEFRLLGTGKCHIRHIDLINPTTENYIFCWTRLYHELNTLPTIQCLSEAGEAEKGKRTRILFSIVPEKIGLSESFWEFEIKKYDLKTLFLVVAHVVEPVVTYRNTLLKLNPCSIGQLQTTSFEITNNECCHLSFNIKANSLYSEGRLQHVCVYPMTGILQPNSSEVFKLEFMPSLAGKHIFKIECQVEKMRAPIELSVISHVLEIVPKITYTDVEGRVIDVTTKSVNYINVNQLVLDELVKLEFQILNAGEIDFEYSWSMNSTQENGFNICVSESQGKVDVNSCCSSYLEIVAREKSTIRNHPLTLTINHGPTYHLKVNASAKKSPLDFSFSEYDFGLCYIHKQNGSTLSTELKITNNQKIPNIVSCNFEDTPYLKLDLCQLSQNIPSQSLVTVPIHFQPLEEKLYKEILIFSSINNSWKEIIIKGEGIPYKLRLKNPCDALIDVGTLRIGKCSCRKVHIVNEGRLPVELKVVVVDYSSENKPNTSDLENHHIEKSDSIADFPKNDIKPMNNEDIDSSKSEDTSLSLESFNLIEFVEFFPSSSRTLKPNKELEVTIKVKALQRIKSLKVKLGLETHFNVFPLLTLKGNFAAASLFLSRNYISFGTIFEGCRMEEKLVLVNDGDVGSKFIWKVDELKPFFKISPLTGYCSAGSEIIFTCVFASSHPASCIQAKATLNLEQHENLTLDVSGNCIPIPEASETIDFTAEDLQPLIQGVTIHNDSSRIWNLKPLIFGECFSCGESISVPPQTIESLNITYKPRKNSTCDSNDEGKLVINLPDERDPIIYNLLGHPCSTINEQKIVRQIWARRKYVETLLIHNKTNEYSIFDCKTEQLINNVKEQLSTFQLHVLPKNQKHCEFPFFFEDEGNYFYTITFDDHKKNYQIYDIEFVVTSLEVENYIELTTHVRSKVFHVLKIENVSDNTGTTFRSSVNEDSIVIHGLPTYIGPLAFKNIQIEFMPLVVCDTTVDLVITSDMMDKMYYKLHLQAKSPLPEKVTCVKTNLGDSTSFSIRLKNHSKEPSEFAMTVDEPSFTCPETVVVPGNQEAIVSLQFKPHGLKTVNANITAKSVTAAEFIFPVIGNTCLPKPRGPFTIGSKVPTALPFENVCLEAKDFEFSVDDDHFLLTSYAASIESRENYDILVQLQDCGRKSSKLRTGKLIVTSSDEELANVKWIYYLRSAQDT